MKLTKNSAAGSDNLLYRNIQSKEFGLREGFLMFQEHRFSMEAS
jgi:hypothetical protein